MQIVFSEERAEALIRNGALAVFECGRTVIVSLFFGRSGQYEKIFLAIFNPTMLRRFERGFAPFIRNPSLLEEREPVSFQGDPVLGIGFAFPSGTVVQTDPYMVIYFRGGSWNEEEPGDDLIEDVEDFLGI